jgi:hypothetical protein
MQEKGVRKMPKVGDKEFAYTPEGEAAAEDYAIETGQEVIPSYDAGGRVRRIEGYGEPSNLVANGEMTQDEVDRYIKPQLAMKKGGKVKKK